MAGSGRRLSTIDGFPTGRIVEPMKLAMKGVNLKLTPALRRYVDGKLARSIEKLLGRHPAYEAATGEIELICPPPHHKKGKIWEAALVMRLPQMRFSQRAQDEDIYAAVDKLEDMAKRELTKYKERSRSRLLRGARRAKKDFHLDRSARLNRAGRIRQEGI